MFYGYSLHGLFQYLTLNLVPLLVLIVEWAMDFINYEFQDTFYIYELIPGMFISLYHFKNYVLGTTSPVWWSSMPAWEKGLWISGAYGVHSAIYFVIAKVTQMVKKTRMTPNPHSFLNKAFQHVADLAAY